VNRWAAYKIYARHKGTSCERCGSASHLIVHHRDEDIANNDLANLETLCRRCHQMTHRCWENLPLGQAPWNKTPERACIWCGQIYHRPAYQIGQGFCSRRCAMLKRNATSVPSAPSSASD